MAHGPRILPEDTALVAHRLVAPLGPQRCMQLTRYNDRGNNTARHREEVGLVRGARCQRTAGEDAVDNLVFDRIGLVPSPSTRPHEFDASLQPLRSSLALVTPDMPPAAAGP
jgi:hypothetical protein